jgi:hypothetical protein
VKEMKMRRSFIFRIRSTLRKIISFKTLIIVIIASLFLWIAHIILESIIGDILVKWLKTLDKYVSPSIIEVFRNHPYLFEFGIFLVILLLIIVHAYMTTGLSKGITIHKVKDEHSHISGVVIDNRTGDNLNNCEVEAIEMIKVGRDAPKDFLYWTQLPAKMLWMENLGLRNAPTEIKDKRQGIIAIAHGEEKGASLITSMGITLWPVINEVKFHFSGITAQGKTVAFEFYVEINYDGKTATIENIYY